MAIPARVTSAPAPPAVVPGRKAHDGFSVVRPGSISLAGSCSAQSCYRPSWNSKHTATQHNEATCILIVVTKDKKSPWRPWHQQIHILPSTFRGRAQHIQYTTHISLIRSSHNEAMHFNP
jgi:hypothetical protein